MHHLGLAYWRFEFLHIARLAAVSKMRNMKEEEKKYVDETGSPRYIRGVLASSFSNIFRFLSAASFHHLNHISAIQGVKSVIFSRFFLFLLSFNSKFVERSLFFCCAVCSLTTRSFVVVRSFFPFLPPSIFSSFFFRPHFLSLSHQHHHPYT